MRNSRIRTITEIGLTVALFAVLTAINVRMPINIAGGSISLAMVPLLVLALQRGVRVGMLAGVLCGAADYLIAPFMLNIAQVFLDYPIAFAAVGLAGIASVTVRKSYTEKDTGTLISSIIAGSLIGIGVRFFAHLISGVIFFAENTPAGQSVWVYSAAYQASYLVPSFLGCLIVTIIVLPAVLGYTTRSSSAGDRG